MRDHLERLRKSRAVDSDLEVPCPPELEYKPYQRAGISYALQRKDTLIGDEMGLGKTIQALGFVNKLGDAVRNVLVVGPATLSFNWKLEAEKWLLGRWLIFVPRSGEDAVPEQPGDQKLLVVTNYDKVVGESKLTASLARVWDVAVFDEAHALKNPRSQRSLAVLGERGLLQRAHRALFLTGTPIENFPKEMWPAGGRAVPGEVRGLVGVRQALLRPPPGAARGPRSLGRHRRDPPGRAPAAAARRLHGAPAEGRRPEGAAPQAAAAGGARGRGGRLVQSPRPEEVEGGVRASVRGGPGPGRGLQDRGGVPGGRAPAGGRDRRRLPGDVRVPARDRT